MSATNKCAPLRCSRRRLLDGAFWRLCVLTVMPACAVETVAESAVETANEIDPVGQPVAESLVREMLSDDWPGHELGLPLPHAYDFGSYAIADEQDDAPAEPPQLVLTGAQPPEEDHTISEVGAFYKGRFFLLKMPRSSALTELVNARLDRALDDTIAHMDPAALGPMETVTPPPEQDGVGVRSEALRLNDPDTREPLLRSKWSDTSWLATIGIVFGNGISQGTGTLISEQAVLTAAHVVIGRNAGTSDPLFRTPTFAPRAEGSAHPWGDWSYDTSRIILFGSSYVSNRCYMPGRYNELCQVDDWAVFPVVRPAEGAALKLFMRVAALSESASRRLKRRGYPECGGMDSPPGCVPETLFGNKTTCKIDFNGGASPARATHDCDTNNGDSGSPFYDYREEQKPTVAAVHIGDCGDSCGLFNMSRVNYLRRITEKMQSDITTYLGKLSMP